jgi:hypothetical protein
MNDAIGEKIRKHLSEPVDTEGGVVYLLCEVRKLLDKQRPDPLPFALRLICHWALRVDLSRRSTTMPFLEQVDSDIYDKLNTRETKETILAEHRLFREFVYLETFRKGFSHFLGSNNSPTSICDEDALWFGFLAAYASVIEDGSLACQSKRPDDTLSTASIPSPRRKELIP